MKEQPLENYLRLRLLVGFLGEAPRFNWWATSFFQPASKQFLDPVFARTAALAQYHGVREAARRAHDEHIGVGNAYHLFRLPEEMEREMHARFEDRQRIEKFMTELGGKESAWQALESLAAGEREVSEGPIHIGMSNELNTDRAFKELARCYKAGFNQNIRSYPYFLAKA